MKTNTQYGKLKLIVAALVVSGMMITVSTVAVVAQTAYDSALRQEIDAGTLSTSVRDDAGNIVGSPSFVMGAVNVSTSMQTSTGTFGSGTQRIAVDNPGQALSGWTLSLNATDPSTGTWSDGASNSYSYNGATAASGQLTINPAAGSLVPVHGGSTGVNLGTQATFSNDSPITIASADATSADIWNGYITGVGLSQTIPAGQPGGNYALDVTQTVAAQ